MSAEFDTYPPGLDWIGFIRKFAKYNGLTHAQAVHQGRAHYHAYKVEDLRAQQQRQPAPAPARPAKPAPKDPRAKPAKKVSYKDPVDDEYQQFLKWKNSAPIAVPEKKQRKKKVVYVTDSEDDDE